MKEYNLVVTLADQGRFRTLMDELSAYGEFRKTEFLGVILGKVDNPGAFLSSVSEKRSRQPFAFHDLGRIVPFDRFFIFRLEDFLEKVKEAIRPYIPLLADKRFYVRLERRGLKGRIVSPEVERALDTFVETELSQMGRSAQIDFEHPDAVVVVETVGDRCGVGFLTREMMDRYDFVRVS